MKENPAVGMERLAEPDMKALSEALAAALVKHCTHRYQKGTRSMQSETQPRSKRCCLRLEPCCKLLQTGYMLPVHPVSASNTSTC